jgi:hypothetical protein
MLVSQRSRTKAFATMGWLLAFAAAVAFAYVAAMASVPLI